MALSMTSSSRSMTSICKRAHIGKKTHAANEYDMENTAYIVKPKSMPRLHQRTPTLSEECTHLLTDAVECSLSAQSLEIGSHKTVCLIGQLLEVDILSQLHVLGVDVQHLQTTVCE